MPKIREINDCIHTSWYKDVLHLGARAIEVVQKLTINEGFVPFDDATRRAMKKNFGVVSFQVTCDNDKHGNYVSFRAKLPPSSTVNPSSSMHRIVNSPRWACKRHAMKGNYSTTITHLHPNPWKLIGRFTGFLRKKQPVIEDTRSPRGLALRDVAGRRTPDNSSRRKPSCPVRRRAVWESTNNKLRGPSTFI